MATGGQFSWPSVGIFVAAYGQFFMAANSYENRLTLARPPFPRSKRLCRSHVSPHDETSHFPRDTSQASSSRKPT